MVVEMFGAPGAGKTSLMPVVAGCLARQGLRAYSVVEAARPFMQRTRLGGLAGRLAPAGLRRAVLWQLFSLYTLSARQVFYNQHAPFIDHVLAFQQQRPIGPADRQHVLHWFIHLTGTYTLLKQYQQPDEVLMFDEGFVHRVVQLFASEVERPDADEVAQYLDQVPRPDLLVYVSAPLAVCQERVVARGIWKRFEGKSRADVASFLASAHSAIQIAANHLQRAGWPVITVENGGPDLQHAAAALESAFWQWQRSQLPAAQEMIYELAAA